MDLNGVVRTKVIGLRFAISGNVSKIYKSRWQTVAKSEIVASLNKKIFQTQLEKELKEYESARAGFEIYSARKSHASDPLDRYFETQEQSRLDTSVKNVELAKAALDNCDLISPVNGVILEDSNIVEGMNITPASSTFSVMDFSSFYAEAGIEQSQFTMFKSQHNAQVVIDGFDGYFTGTTSLPYTDGKLVFIRIHIDYTENLLPGLKCNIRIQP